MAWAADSKERSHIWNLTYTLFFLQSTEVIKLRKRTIFKQKLISTKSKEFALNFEASSGRSVIAYSMKKQLILECLQLNTTQYNNYVDGIIIIIKIIMIMILTLKSLLKRTWIDRCGSSTAYKQRYMIPRNKRFKPSETLKQTSKIVFTLPYITFTLGSFLLVHNQKCVLLTQKDHSYRELLSSFLSTSVPSTKATYSLIWNCQKWKITKSLLIKESDVIIYMYNQHTVITLPV